MMWQPIETVLTDATRVWLAFDTGPKPTDWDMVACRYSNGGWYLSPNGEIGSPIYFRPTHWMKIDPPTN